MENLRAWLGRFLSVQDGLQFLVLDVNQIDRTLRDIVIVCDNRGNLVPNELHLVPAECRFILVTTSSGPNPSDVLSSEHRVNAVQR
jgi:hypothetical protein